MYVVEAGEAIVSDAEVRVCVCSWGGHGGGAPRQQQALAHLCAPIKGKGADRLLQRPRAEDRAHDLQGEA